MIALRYVPWGCPVYEADIFEDENTICLGVNSLQKDGQYGKVVIKRKIQTLATFYKDTLKLEDEKLVELIGKTTQYSKADFREKLGDLRLEGIKNAADAFYYNVAASKNPHLLKHTISLDYRFLYKYIDNLEEIEKLFSVMNNTDLIKLIENGDLEVNSGGKKAKQVIGVPLDIIDQMKELGIGVEINRVKKLIEDGYEADEIRKMFRFIEKLNMSRKTSIGRVLNDEDKSNSWAFESIMEAAEADGSKTFSKCLTYVLKETLMLTSFTKSKIYDMFRLYRDCYRMIGENNLETKLEHNIRLQHHFLARNLRILKNANSEKYAEAAKELNQNSMRVGRWLIKTPETARELVEIGVAHGNCLPTYVDRVADGKAILYAMYEDGEKIPRVVFEMTQGLDFVQVKTFNDRDVDDPEVIEALKVFQRELRKAQKGALNGREVLCS